jgi:acyl-CoA thioesterase FadM
MLLEGRARLRVAVEIAQQESAAPVATGYTVHAFTDASGKAMRPPGWFLERVRQPANDPPCDARPAESGLHGFQTGSS